MTLVAGLLLALSGKPRLAIGGLNGWPELTPEMPDFWAAASAPPAEPPDDDDEDDLPSSAPSAALRLPCLVIVGAPGPLPAFVTIWEPARVAVWVWPFALTLMLLPNTKSEVVLSCVTVKIAMPPRIPIVAEGVVMVIGLVLLILPPTRRKTPLLALMARSPVLVAGSK